ARTRRACARRPPVAERHADRAPAAAWIVPGAHRRPAARQAGLARSRPDDAARRACQAGGAQDRGRRVIRRAGLKACIRAGMKACTTMTFVISVAVAANAASLFDPIYRFRTLTTPHFIIYFHQGEERLASRLAAIAEETWTALERPLGVK